METITIETNNRDFVLALAQSVVSSEEWARCVIVGDSLQVPNDVFTTINEALTATELPFSAFPVLSAAQFEAALLIMGVDPDGVQPAIKAVITEPVAQAQALGAWRRLTSIRRDNETMELLKPVFNLTDAMITDAWWAAAGQEPPTLA